MEPPFVRCRSGRTHRALFVGLVAIAGCSMFDDPGGPFAEMREYRQNPCPPATGLHDQCQWFAFLPTGRVDFNYQGDILIRGSYEVIKSRVRIWSEVYDSEGRLSGNHDTLSIQGLRLVRQP